MKKYKKKKSTTYHENGTVHTDWYYDDDIDNSRRITYDENGNKISEGYYENGKMEGKHTFYNEDGSIKFVHQYKNGEKVDKEQSTLLEEFKKSIKGKTLRFSHQLKRTKKKDHSTS